MFADCPEIKQGMQVMEFDGVLDHKNPKCNECGNHCFSLYSGGRKEKLTEMYVCKNCKIIYTLPQEKKCEFTEKKND